MFFFAEHGEGEWTPKIIANNFEQYVSIIEYLKGLCSKRQTPVELERNPIQKTEYDDFKTFIEVQLNLDFSNWELWVELEDYKHVNEKKGGFFARLFK